MSLFLYKSRVTECFFRTAVHPIILLRWTAGGLNSSAEKCRQNTQTINQQNCKLLSCRAVCIGNKQTNKKVNLL